MQKQLINLTRPKLNALNFCAGLIGIPNCFPYSLLIVGKEFPRQR